MVDERPADRTIRELLVRQGSFSVGQLSAATGLSRQALHRHLTRWLAGGDLVREGAGRGTHYRSPEAGRFERAYTRAGLDEAAVWEDVVDWLEAQEPLSAQAEGALHHVLTEIVNNAIDHSGAAVVRVRCERAPDRVRLEIRDEGIGAFENLRTNLELEDHFDALIELSKGKVTTMPEAHTGEGIFFSSRMVALFVLGANGLRWIVDNEAGDHAVLAAVTGPGTGVEIELDPSSQLDPNAVFARYTHDFEFDTTSCVIRLLDYGVRFISRSEAKRLVRGLERFREVRLDFTGVEGVGQGFVDEVFRVWARRHPDVRLVPFAMNDVVAFMVRRGLPKR